MLNDGGRERNFGDWRGRAHDRFGFDLLTGRTRHLDAAA
jgi:hypothetical protein